MTSRSPADGWPGSEPRLAILAPDLPVDVVARARAFLDALRTSEAPPPYIYAFDGDIVLEWHGPGAPRVTITTTGADVAIVEPGCRALAAYIRELL